MKRLLAALVFVTVLFAGVASAGHKQEEYWRYARWAGCTAALITSDERSILESFYRPYTHALYIGTQDTSQHFMLIVLFHEIGHCLQFQRYTLPEIQEIYQTRVALELDADRLAADLACSMGMEGKRMLRDIFEWAHEEFGYDGDPEHGSLAERIGQGELAPACNPAPIQAPILGR